MARDNGYWRSDSLGEPKGLELSQGTLCYHDTGSGPTLVFVHGALVNANLWRKVVAQLSPELRCVALELPLGAHRVAMPPEADLSPPALADLVADAIEALGLEEVTLVGNDTGGAICQLVVTRRPERVGRLVLTDCDAFENFPPKSVQPLLPALRIPGVLTAMLAPTRLKAVRNRMLTLMQIVKRPIEQEAVDSYALPPLRDRAVKRDAKKVLAGMEKGMLVKTSERLRDFEKPALIAWAREDKLFPPKYAERLAATLPDARLEWIDDSRTFSPEDQPGKVAELIKGFVREAAAA